VPSSRVEDQSAQGDVAARRSARMSLVGQRYRLGPVLVDEQAAAGYALATGDDPARFLGAGIAPPLLAVRFVAPLWRQIYQDPRLHTSDQLVLHAEQRMLFAADLRLGMPVTVTGRVAGIVGFGLGDAALIRSRLLDERDRVIVSMECTLAVRGSTAQPARRRGSLTLARGETACECRRHFDAQTPARYADAADDHNPLHLDDAAARAAGHPGRIAHGMCTLASGVAALPPDRLGLRSARMRYLRARFTRPVLPGADVLYRAERTGSATTFGMTATVDGRPVLKGAWLDFSG
jgi:acyl dehydratase